MSGWDPSVGRVVIIGGPTASGKSALALDLAERRNGVVINADAMQVYRELRVLTARPGPEQEARAPHRLYGIMSAGERCSAGRWRGLAVGEIEAARAAGRLPVVVGGSGLYLRALMDGIAPVPRIPDDVRRAAGALHRRLGGEAFHAMLEGRDPEMARRLSPGDGQRLVRAWEVLEATGRSLADWQREPHDTSRYDFEAIVLLPPRELLYATCDSRFRAMLDAGALEEVRALDKLGLSDVQPIMKALGVRELRAHLRGEIELDAAVRLAGQATRRYAKRQLTWFRHQMEEATKIASQYSFKNRAEIFSKMA
ncbi:MAG: tRNA (adenosine(37)-N6)-dimethylallyltransferase MiaA [Alphaproteobacteria bacterium]